MFCTMGPELNPQIIERAFETGLAIVALLHRRTAGQGKREPKAELLGACKRCQTHIIEECNGCEATAYLKSLCAVSLKVENICRGGSMH
jgi:hypothetical protein